MLNSARITGIFPLYPVFHQEVK